MVKALNSWGQVSDRERIAQAARAVLGANDVDKAFFVDGQTGFLETSAVTGSLAGVVALANLNDVIKRGNPFAIAKHLHDPNQCSGGNGHDRQPSKRRLSNA